MVLISLCALCLLIFIILKPFSLPIRLSDHWMMVRLAESIAEGEPEVSPYWNLGYSSLLALFAKLFGGYENSAKVISLAGGIYLLLVSYLLSRKYLGKKWAHGVLWAVAGSEAFVFCAPGLKDYLLFAAILVTAIMVLEWALSRGRWWTFLMAGAVLGTGFLDRYICLLLLPVFLLGILVKAEGWRRRLTFSAVYLGAFIILASPQMVINLWREGTPFYAGNVRTIWFALQGTTDWSILFEHEGQESIVNLLSENPTGIVILWLKNLCALLMTPLIQVPLFVFGWAGLVYLWFKRKGWHLGLASAILVVYCVLTLLFNYGGKYFLALSPYMAVGALSLMREVIPGRVGKGPRPPLLVPVVVMFIVSALAISFYSVKNDSHYRWEEEAIFEVADTLSEEGITDPKAVLSTNYDLYLVEADSADKQFAMVPFDISTVEDLTSYINKEGYGYLIAYHRGWTEGYWRGLTAQLIEPRNMPNNYQPIYTKEGVQRIVVYRVVR